MHQPQKLGVVLYSLPTPTHRIIFLLMIVRSLFCNFDRCAVCFQSFMNVACMSTQLSRVSNAFQDYTSL